MLQDNARGAPVRSVHRVLARELDSAELSEIKGAGYSGGSTYSTRHPNGTSTPDSDVGGTWKWRF